MSANRQFNQNVDIWVKSGESVKRWCFGAIRWDLIKMLKFEWKMSKSIKIFKFEYNKAASIKMLKFQRKRGDWSNVDILLPSGNQSKCLNLIENKE